MTRRSVVLRLTNCSPCSSRWYDAVADARVGVRQRCWLAPQSERRLRLRSARHSPQAQQEAWRLSGRVIKRQQLTRSWRISRVESRCCDCFRVTLEQGRRRWHSLRRRLPRHQAGRRHSSPRPSFLHGSTPRPRSDCWRRSTLALNYLLEASRRQNVDAFAPPRSLVRPRC